MEQKPMDRDTAMKLLRMQQAGYKRLREFEIMEAQRATFADRLQSFRRIMGFSKYLPVRDSRHEDSQVIERWIKIRERYKSIHG